MTDLNRPVKRRTCRPADLVRRRLVVMLEPGDTLAMREHGRRKIYRRSLERIYLQMVRWQVDEDRRKKAEDKKNQKGAR